MKKILNVLLISFFVFTGCAQKLAEVEKENAESYKVPELTLENKGEDDKTDKADKKIEEIKQEEKEVSQLSYQDWAMPKYEEEDVYVIVEDMKTDCVGVANGMTYGGDLLSSLIVDNDLRRKLSLELYSKTYIMNLEKKLASYTQSKYKSDFYAFSVCNLDEDMDLVSGYLWPQGNATDYESFEVSKGILFLTKGNDVLKIDSVRLFDNTATGAEVFPCTGELADEGFNWTCFLGLTEAGSMMGTWNISTVDGKVLDYKEYEEVEVY